MRDGPTDTATPPRVCILSHRLGGYDGVSVEAAKWHSAFNRLGWSVTRAAGFFADRMTEDDVLVAGLWACSYGARPPAPDPAQIADLCATHDLLVIDNAGSLPTAPETALVVEREALRSKTPTIVRHHDPPWQGGRLTPAESARFPLHDPRMLHVTINRLTESEYRCRYPDLEAENAITTMHNTVDTASLGYGKRWATRKRLGISECGVLLAHPARNIGRKNIPAALAMATRLGRRTGRPIHYWLTDPSGDIGPTPPGVTIHRGHVTDPADVYAAADLVVLTSTWEGWGLPVVEAAAARRPVITFPYPVLGEIHGLGIHTVDHADGDGLSRLITDRSSRRDLTAANYRRAAHLDVRRLPVRLHRAYERAAALIAPERKLR